MSFELSVLTSSQLAESTCISRLNLTSFFLLQAFLISLTSDVLNI